MCHHLLVNGTQTEHKLLPLHFSIHTVVPGLCFFHVLKIGSITDSFRPLDFISFWK